MFTIPLPLADWALLLALPWPHLHPLARFPLIGAIVLVPLVLLVALYRYEMRLVRPATAAGLLALRLLVLFAVLALVCLQPVVSHETRVELPGRVIVVVDRSASTALADPQRAPAAKLRLALAFGLHRPGLPDALVRQWAEQLEAGREPTWATPDEGGADATGRRQAYQSLLARVDQLTRAEVARLVLAPEGLGVLGALAGKHQVELWGVDKGVRELRPEQLDELFANPKGAALAAAGFTDLSAPLARAQQSSSPRQGQVLGVVLLTDGQHNSGPAPDKAARELGRRKVPVYAVALGAKEPPPDAAIVSVRGASQNFYKDVEGQVDVKAKIAGLPAGEFVVSLQEEGKGDAAPPRTIRHDGKARVYPLSFRVKLNEVGPKKLTARVKPVAAFKEAALENNALATTVNVADDRARILLADGEARWEYHYLATALERDKLVKLKKVVFEQPRLEPRLTPEDAEKAGLPAWQWPGGEEPFGALDCVILGDVSPEALPLATRQKLERFVGEGGGTLVIVAGKNWMPHGFSEGTPAGGPDPLRRLLPIESPRPLSPEEGMKLSLTRAGREQRFMELDAAAGENAELWAGWPRPWPWAVLGKAKPGATPLLNWVTPADMALDPVARERVGVAAAWHNYGFGRVLFVGLDGTWRLRYRVGDLYHHRFWGQVVRWAAGGKPLTAGNDSVRFGTAQVVYRTGDAIDVTARFAEGLGPLKPGMLAGARVVRLPEAPGGAEEPAALVPLLSSRARPRMWNGQLRGLPAGKYALELAVPDLAPHLLEAPKGGKPKKPLRATFVVLPPEPQELLSLETNYPLLEGLAAGSGGQVFEPEQAGDLRDLLARKAAVQVERHDLKLFQWWGMLAAVAGLLTAEWVARKMAGLR